MSFVFANHVCFIYVFIQWYNNTIATIHFYTTSQKLTTEVIVYMNI